MSNAQSIEEIKKQTELIKAQTEHTQAQTADNNAKKDLLASDKTLKLEEAAPSADEQRHQDAVKRATAAKELAVAKQGQIDAELAEKKSRWAVPASGISGDVTKETGAAGLETALLASRATNLAAKKIAELVATIPGIQKIFVLSPGDLPDFQAATAYHLQLTGVKRALKEAANLKWPIPSQTDGTGPRTESVAGVGLALESVSKLLGFFKSEFTVAGADIAADNQLLQQSFAGALLHQDSKREVYLYSLYFPTSVPNDELPEDLRQLTQYRHAAREALDTFERDSAAPTNRRGDTGNTPVPAADVGASEQRKMIADKIDQAKAALSAYDAFVAGLHGPEGNGAAVIRQRALLKELQSTDTCLVLLKLNKAGGTSYTEKNLWTSFGAMPFKVAGGAIASFTAFNAASGRVLAARTIEIHGGYSNVKQLPDDLEKAGPVTPWPSSPLSSAAASGTRAVD